jgi:MFS family permease
MVGTLISALAVNVNMLICGSMIKALAASTQLSAFYAMGELIPAKYRYFLVGAMNIWQIPGAILAPAVANSIIQLGGSWRSVFYLLTAVNTASMICYFFFYHPPTFHQKQGLHEKKREFIKSFDYIGTALYSTGLVFFLLGLSWGGSKYPWNSPQVISFVVVGFTSLLSFILWECFARPKEPLIPIELFRNKDWVVATALCGIGAGVFYAGAS